MGSTSHAAMKQTFLVFPAGSAGLALLLLRVAVFLTLLNPPFPSMAATSLAMIACDLLALAVGFGLFTRTAATLSVATLLVSAAMGGTLPALASAPFFFTASALAIIGPGAISIDARMFGRRTVHLSR